MNNALLTFAVVLAVYFVGLIIFSIIKRIHYKRKFKKEEKKNAELNKDSNDKE